MLFPIVNALKRIVTVPRMHHLDFLPDPEARVRVRRVRIVVSAAMGLLIALGALAFFTSRMISVPVSAWLRENAIVVFGLLLAALFVLLGWGTATGRLRAYAIITTAALVVGHWFDMRPAWFFIVLGAVIAAWGSTVLTRFVRVYPRLNGNRVRERSYRLIPGRMEE
jgi:small-conductance mechanosensitive channel